MTLQQVTLRTKKKIISNQHSHFQILK